MKKFCCCFALFFYFWPCHAACGIQFPDQGFEPVSHAVEAESSPLDSQEVPSQVFLCLFSKVNTLASIEKMCQLGKNELFQHSLSYGR